MEARMMQRMTERGPGRRGGGWARLFLPPLCALALLAPGTLHAGSARAAATPTLIVGGLNSPQGVAVDGGGNVYIADTGNNQVLKETPTGAGYAPSVVDSGFAAAPTEVAVDAQGTVYLATGDGGNGVVTESPSGGGYQRAVIIPSPSDPFGLAVDGSGAVYITTVQPGQILKETPGSGGYAQSTVASGLAWPQGVAVDGAGAVYVADSSANAVLKETPGGGGYTQSTVAQGVSDPLGVAVDGSGAVYVTDEYGGRAIEETPSGGGFAQGAIAGGLGIPWGVAADGHGAVYVADSGQGVVTKETPTGAGAGYTRSVVVSGLLYAKGVAVDGGAVYIAESNRQQVVKVTPTGAGYTQSVVASGLDGPTGVAVDTRGVVYVTNQGDSTAAIFTPTGGGGYTQSSLGSGLNSADGVAVDGGGNVFIADTQNQRVVEETPGGGGYTQSTVVGISSPNGVAVDGNGALYIAAGAGVYELAGAATPPPPRIINDTDGGIVYSGNGGDGATGGWWHSTGRGKGDYQDDVHATPHNGDAFSYTFAGTGIRFITERNADEGKDDVYIDGVGQATVDTSSAAARTSQQVVYSISGLAPGAHTLKVVKRSGTWMLLDALTVLTNGSVANDTAPGIAYSGGGWSHSTGRGLGDYLDDVHATSHANDSFSYTFTGTGITYLGEKSADEGTVQIEIDGKNMGTVNCHVSAHNVPQQVIYSVGGLPAGTHTLKVVNLTQNYWLVLDALTVQ